MKKGIFTVSRIQTIPREDIIGCLTLHIPIINSDAFELFQYLIHNQKEQFEVTFKKINLNLFDNILDVTPQKINNPTQEIPNKSPVQGEFEDLSIYKKKAIQPTEPKKRGE